MVWRQIEVDRGFGLQTFDEIKLVGRKLQYINGVWTGWVERQNASSNIAPQAHILAIG